ncbi:hypothetical protein [Chitinophaga rhizosphaerae]|uniref:hypothetical protein n=1 Tax=Chitinophaga rhizosphaerae TaxID=1864947 RepID=UPI000F80E331|nr:hypothetical protein [Chitinophaga rhizosphaerae]
MKKSLRIAGVFLALFFSYDGVKAQVKIGGDPAVVDANAILELESARKGLLLPRLNKTGYELLVSRNPTPGMVVYVNDGAADSRGVGFYVKTADGNTKAAWTKMAGDAGGAGPWKLTGNDVSAGDWLGTTNTFPLIFKANNNEVMRFDPNTGNITVPYANVPDAAASSNQVVIIGTDGLIQKKDLSLTSVTGVNGLQGNLTMSISPANTNDIAELVITGASKTLDVKLPIMIGGTTQQYGFMTIDDWKKLQAITSVDGISVGNIVSDGTATEQGARIVRLTGADEGKLVLHMIEASETAAGVVSTGAQVFAGAKTFNNAATFKNTVTTEGAATFKSTAAFEKPATFAETVAITGNTTVGGTLTTTGDATFNGNTIVGQALTFNNPTPFSTAVPATYYMAVLNDQAGFALETVEIPAHSLNGISKVKVPGNADVTALSTDGSINIEAGKDGSGFSIVTTPNTVKVNVPDASATAAGIVTTESQSFKGQKTILDTLNIGGNAVVGSKVNINGSMSIPFRILTPGDHTLGIDDYMVVAKCASSGTGAVGETEPVSTITLPAAASAKNRVYMIRREQRITDEIAQLHIVASGGQISGRASVIISEPGFTVTVVSDGTTWYMVSRSVM